MSMAHVAQPAQQQLEWLNGSTQAILLDGAATAGLSEGGVIYLPRNIPHAYRITSPRADMLMIRCFGGTIIGSPC